jgi:hypothetical protein
MGTEESRLESRLIRNHNCLSVTAIPHHEWSASMQKDRKKLTALSVRRAKSPVPSLKIVLSPLGWRSTVLNDAHERLDPNDELWRPFLDGLGALRTMRSNHECILILSFPPWARSRWTHDLQLLRGRPLDSQEGRLVDSVFRHTPYAVPRPFLSDQMTFARPLCWSSAWLAPCGKLCSRIAILMLAI